MTTIILTIIGILLAAAAALMVIFYGGDAFNGGSVKAQANELYNAATNVSSAAVLYKADHGRWPNNIYELTDPNAGPSGSYLAAQPEHTMRVEYYGTFMPFPGLAPDRVHIYFGYSSNTKSEAICRMINRENGLSETSNDPTVGKRGCWYGQRTFYQNF